MAISIPTSIMGNPMGTEVKEAEISITKTTSITIEGTTSIVREAIMGKEEDKITVMIDLMMTETLEIKAINRTLQITNPITKIRSIHKTLKGNHHKIPLNKMATFKAKIEEPLQTSTMIIEATIIIAILVKEIETVGASMMEGTNMEVKEDSSETEIATSSPKGK